MTELTPASEPIVVIGESVMDLVVSGDQSAAHPGGSPANVALGLGRLRVPVCFLTELGTDDYGRQICDHLRVNGVHLSVAEIGTTASAAAVIDPVTGSAHYDFKVTWSLTSGLPADISEAAHLHTGSIASVMEPGARVVADLLSTSRKTATISYDPNVRPSLIVDGDAVRRRIAKLIALADIVKCSDEDLEYIAPGLSAEQAAQCWLDDGAALVVITMGGSGALLAGRAETVTVPVREVAVSDTVGAGDSFMSALLAWLFKHDYLGIANRVRLASITGADLCALGDFCTRVAAVTVSRSGANPPYLDEVRAPL